MSMKTSHRRPGRPELPLEGLEGDETGKVWPNRLREYRLKHGYSLKDVAEILGVKPQTISTAELYGRGLGRESLYKLADLYAVDPRVLEGRNVEVIGENSTPKGL